MLLEWPQITYLSIVTLVLVGVLQRHGQPRKDSYNFWATLIVHAGVAVVLYFGGFFTAY